MLCTLTIAKSFILAGQSAFLQGVQFDASLRHRNSGMMRETQQIVCVTVVRYANVKQYQ